MAMKIFNFDLETTGLDCKKHGITQMAGIITVPKTAKRHTFNFKIRPFEGKEVTQGALDITGMTVEQIATFADALKGYKLLLEVMGKFVDKFNPKDKFVVMGYNCGFDTDFLRQFFLDCGDKYYGSWFNSFNTIDVHKLFTGLRGSGFYPELEALPNMKLITLATHYGIAIDAHDALSDIQATQELYYIWVKQMSRYGKVPPA